MKKLLIVESPAKIKTISKFLGKDFVIMSTIGHIKDLPQKTLGVTINGEIKLEYVVMADKDKVINGIVSQAKKSDVVYLAPDPDREGEIIAWHIGQEIENVLPEDKIFRITFNEITKNAILESLENPSKINMDKVAAQQARRVLDRWVGYEVSPVLWKKISKGLSAGRVQSVALRLICDREEEIRNFKQEEYWSIEGLFNYSNSSFVASLTQIDNKKFEIKNKDDASNVVKEIKKASYIIDSIQDKTRSKKPYAPFMTSSLQQAAYNQLGFSVKKTMDVAQKLYEGIPIDDSNTPTALITYMRTDSLRISDTAIQQARKFVDSQFGKKYLPSKANLYLRKKDSQDAHEAIRPIDVSLTPEKVKQHIPADAAKLYDLIWRRFVSCQMKPAEYAQRQVTIIGDKFTFKVTGSTLIFDGYLKVYNPEEEEKEPTVVLPADLKEKSPVKLEKVDPKQHFTQPPARYTEGSLVKELEKEGIGRPSTYAAILNTIRARSYTQLDAKKRFTPTELGFAVTKLLVKNLPRIMDIKFTAHMEEDLDKIAHHKIERDKVLKDFYKKFKKEVDTFQGETKGKVAQKTDILCPLCKKNNLVIRFGKAGEFLGCSAYPECSFTSNFMRDEKGVIQLVEEKAIKFVEQNCPKCMKLLRIVKGKFGEFIACSGYPECKYIHQEKASFKCPSCKTGDVVKRKWRGGSFWGCTNYPKCKFSVFAEIEEKPCPQCKLPFLIKEKDKKGNVKLRCSNKECGYKEEVK